MKRFYSHVVKGSSDGCTGVPDFNISKCCVVHDAFYEVGGTGKQRKAADKFFRHCIKSRGHPVLAWIYYFGVRIFGRFHFNYRIKTDVKE